MTATTRALPRASSSGVLAALGPAPTTTAVWSFQLTTGLYFESNQLAVDAAGEIRPHYEHLYQSLLELPAEELKRRQQVADLSFLHQGITFTVYGREEGTERIFPNDLLPRILTSGEWAHIECVCD